MIEKTYIITCDWCGDERHFFLTKRKDEVLNKYAAVHILYEYKPINPLTDELFLKSHDFVCKHLTFCCEECAEKWFDENRDFIPHYILRKPKSKEK